jgi:hypothetical protein
MCAFCVYSECPEYCIDCSDPATCTSCVESKNLPDFVLVNDVDGVFCMRKKARFLVVDIDLSLFRINNYSA